MATWGGGGYRRRAAMGVARVGRGVNVGSMHRGGEAGGSD